jgi:bifunctional enzyme CysN/CysC
MRRPTTARELLAQDERKDLLRFVTAGSVDDGKSTLIGQLLVESQGVYEDQLDAVRKASGRRAAVHQDLDLSLITDGLRAEREQGITIDVAYRYFSTPRRKFIIADTPGHEQYTRNMATGASTADLAVILIDARHGVLTQSKRHSFITALLGIPHVVVTVNKMDLVDYSEDVFRGIVQDYRDFAARLDLPDVTFIPISALCGDNISSRSERMDWYDGPTLLGHLETVHIASDRNLIDMRFPVQYVTRMPDGRRGYMGTPVSGIVRAGEEIQIAPSGTRSRISSVLGVDGPVQEGFPPLPITVVLEDEIDVSRGDVLVPVRNVPHIDRGFEAMVVWMSPEPMELGRRYTIKQGCRTVPGLVSHVRYQIDVNTLHRHPAERLELNEIGRCVIDLARPVVYDPYRKSRGLGSFVIVDRETHNTVGAGMILDREPGEAQVDEARRVDVPRSQHVSPQVSAVSAEDRHARLGHEPATVWLTGLTGAGKSTIAYALERRLFDEGRTSQVLDGGNLRLGVNKDLGFSANERAENIRRAAEIARMLNDAGMISICALLSPYAAERRRAREIVGSGRFIEVYLAASLETCRERARNGLYGKAEAGEVKNFSGVSAPYEPPDDPDLVLSTDHVGVEECVEKIIRLMESRGVFGNR